MAHLTQQHGRRDSSPEFKEVRCPWCDHNPVSRFSWDRRGRYQAGTHATKRLLRKGRVRIVARQRPNGITQDQVVCAHLCHG